MISTNSDAGHPINLISVTCDARLSWLSSPARDFYRNRFVAETREMASQPLERYELTKLAEKLNRDYYPLTELLCKNAKVQAGWLKENNAGTAPFLQFCNELSDKIGRHVAMSRFVIEGDREREPGVVFSSGEAFLQSRESIFKVFADIRREGKEKTAAEWEELRDNLEMKLSVLNNLMVELFRIEDKDLIPLLEKNLLFN